VSFAGSSGDVEVEFVGPPAVAGFWRELFQIDVLCGPRRVMIV
jgi:hypothetical protein